MECASKVLHTEKAVRKRGVPPTASGLEAVLIKQKETGEGKGGGVKRIVDGPPVDEGGKS